MMSIGFLASLIGFLGVAVWYAWTRQQKLTVDRRLKWLVYGGGLILYVAALAKSISDYLGGRADSTSLAAVAVTGFVVSGAVSSNLYELVLKRRMERVEFERLRRCFPDSPWRWDRRWQGKGILYSNKGDVIFGVALAAVVNGGLTVFYIAQREEIRERLSEDPWENLCIYYVFLMGGLFALRYAVNAVMKWQKYGIALFEMTSAPGVIGGAIEGSIQTRFKQVPQEGFDLRLSCIEMDVSFRNASNWIPEQVLWEAVKKVRIEDIRMGERGISLPVCFAIPPGAEETDTWSRSRRVTWALRVTASVDSQPFAAVFRVPVFKPAAGNDGKCVQQDCAAT